MSGTGRPTLSDVAASAGVSLSTASLVFSGTKPVSDGTRVRVLAAADALGYLGPDPAAASLRRGRSGVVGVLVGDRLINAFRDAVTVATLDGISEVFDELGTGLLLMPGGPASSRTTVDRVARLALDAVVFGWCGADDEPSLDQLRRRGIPLVGVEGPHAPDVPLVDIDHRGGSRALARHLHDLGHRDVGVVTLPLVADGRDGRADDARVGSCRFHDARERLTGVREVMGEVRVWEAARHHVDDGRRAAHGLLADPATAPTAVVAQSDLLAVGVVLAAAELGLDVPGDLSVVGFDGVETPWLGPHTLTTAVQPMVEKGRIAGRMVGAMLAGERPDDVVLPVEVRLGTTTGPAPT
ncbi:LacI family DNA-binding transcriptional regulator [Solicola sp. PLA-1-18]|uniref:LacI family DNA-binding transcriptional regulator n=1 Tax=Solicola sp. PLA-1-18 TaxID=3380532 RepID=UPI003B7E85FB